MSSLSLGIVGLPNVGKSTLFNALTNQNVLAANYPFATIDPNVGIVPVQDSRLQQLTTLIKPAKTTPAVVEFWDIAGIVKGAATGAGLGNKFLANIRNVNAIVHVVRGFAKAGVTHVENSVDPARDLELINTELILKDLETLESKIRATKTRSRSEKEQVAVLEMLMELQQHLSEGKLALTFEYDLTNEDIVIGFNELFLLTSKPVIYVVNSEQSKIAQNIDLIKHLVHPSSSVIGMDIQLESEMAALSPQEQAEYLQELEIEEPALALLTRTAYKTLGLISFFTAGEQEVRAWTIKQGFTAPQAAGVIHTDFEKKFITAEIVKFNDFIASGGWVGSKQNGKFKLGGKDYIMEDGDVVMFKHNA